MKISRKVEVVSYNSNWPNLFNIEAQKFENALGAFLCTIYHMGSTAIPHMSAKPVIDILLECENLDDIEIINEKLVIFGYHPVRRHIIPHRSFFTRREEENIPYHLHIRERGDPQIKRHINFRDYLIHHPEDARKYAELKIKLANEFTYDINSYILGKDKLLIQAIDHKAKTWLGRKKDYLSPNPGPLALHWSQEKLIKAMEANLNVHMTHFAQYINQVELIRLPGYTLINSGLNDDTFNYVLEADLSEENVEKTIAQIIQKFANKKLPFSWWVCPYDKPDDLVEKLKKSGLVNTENNVGMYLDLDNWTKLPQHEDLKIIRVKDVKGLHDFAKILATDLNIWEKYYSWIAEIFTDDDPMEFYVGYVDGKPVTRGELVYFGQVAGIHFVSTALDERRQGYGTAIEQFLLQRAKDIGYHIAVLQASAEGLPLYLRQGFKECCVIKEFKPVVSNLYDIFQDKNRVKKFRQ